MLITELQKFFIASSRKTFGSQEVFWFSLSLIFGLIYALLAFQKAFRGEYIVQDDARQHVFWMLRFLDRDLFSQDLIADYFQSMAPAGYKAVYQLPAMMGINPLLLNKLLPPLLTLMMTAYCFGVSMQLLPIPATGFMATLLLNQNLWMKDDIISATPRAFVYPLFLAFLYYVLRRNLIGVGVAIALLGLFYPQCVFLGAGILILRLFHWENWRPRLSQNRADLLLCFAGLAVAFLVLLPFALSTSKFGPTITASEAKQFPEFLPGGRSAFFHQNPFKFIFTGYRSGMFPRSLFTPVTLCIGLLLPVLLRFPAKFSLGKQLTSQIAILPQLLIVSIGMFFAAHAVLFKLHLPSRYTGIAFRIVIALATAIAFTILFEALLKKANENRLFLVPLGILLVALVGYPSFVKDFPKTAYRIGEAPAVYEFFQKTPKESLIASVTDEANNLPTFAQRSILVGSEYAIPYHVGYYRQFRGRTIDLIRAQYSPDLAEVKNFIRQYGVDYWLLDAGGLTPEYLANNKRVQQYQPVAAEALAKLQQGAVPALSKAMKTCKLLEDEKFTILQADCVLNLK